MKLKPFVVGSIWLLLGIGFLCHALEISAETFVGIGICVGGVFFSVDQWVLHLARAVRKQEE